MITINGVACSATSVLQNGDVICHTLHRHEPPVSATEPTVLHCDERLLVVDKPPSLAVHSCGRYWHNTLMGILQHHGYGPLYRQYSTPLRHTQSNRTLTRMTG